MNKNWILLLGPRTGVLILLARPARQSESDGIRLALCGSRRHVASYKVLGVANGTGPMHLLRERITIPVKANPQVPGPGWSRLDLRSLPQEVAAL